MEIDTSLLPLSPSSFLWLCQDMHLNKDWRIMPKESKNNRPFWRSEGVQITKTELGNGFLILSDGIIPPSWSICSPTECDPGTKKRREKKDERCAVKEASYEGTCIICKHMCLSFILAPVWLLNIYLTSSIQVFLNKGLWTNFRNKTTTCCYASLFRKIHAHERFWFK